MIGLNVDLSSFGFRWMGHYAESTQYNKGDVVNKDGQPQYWSGSAWIPMGWSSGNAQTPNSIAVTGNSALTGYPGQTLTVNSYGQLEWVWMEGRNSTAVAKLAENVFCDTGYTGGTHHFCVIMTDGSVRCWGRSNQGQLGDGYRGDRGRTMPSLVGFPPGTPPIVELSIARHSNYAIDASGQLWAWGENNYGQLGQGHTTQNHGTAVPLLVNGNGDLPSDAKVVSVKPGTGWYGYHNCMCQTDDGKVYYWGSNRYCASGIPAEGTNTILVPRLVPASEQYNITDYFTQAYYHQASYLITDQGHLLVAGESGSIGRVQNNGNANSEHELWAPSTVYPIKKVITEESDYHAADGNQYYRRNMYIGVNGEIFTFGNDEYSNNVPDFGDSWIPHRDTRMTNVEDAYVSGGYYQQQVVLRKDGSVWGTGYNGHTSLLHTGDSGRAWIQLDELGYNNVRIRGGGSRYGKYGFREDTNNRLRAWGNIKRGNSGAGNMETSGLMRETLFNRPILDWKVYGYSYDATANQNLIVLSDDGNAYTAGYGGYAQLGREDDGEDSYTLTPVLF